MTPSTTPQERWDRVAEIFDRAVLMPRRERAEYVDATCETDPALRAELHELLAAHDRSGALEQLQERLADAVDHAVLGASESPAHIGGYRIGEPLGAGGMGVVYLAAREGDGFEQRVAIKVLRTGPAVGSLLPRFLAERRILARLEHPSVPRFIDGGLTEHGVPYFAMEYVEGTPIDKYCDEGRLSIRQRLALFLTVCDAIHYAHQHLVVHRDIKPSNILVTSAGAVKVLDFGIAKLLDTPTDEGLSGSGQRWMTPEYASPEQVRGDPVTTAADIYALGVVLYELLAGRRPHSGVTGRELERAILEIEPVAPSTAIASRNVQRQIAGDLDTIVLKALSKDAHRRYGSAAELGDDVRRHLAGLVVRARPDTPTYKLHKFVTRHRRLVAAMVVAAVSLIAGVVATTIATQRARANAVVAAHERDRAEEVSRFVVGLFAAADPMQTGKTEVTAAMLLDSGAARLKRELADQPIACAAMLDVLTESYLGLGRMNEARAANDEAVALRRAARPLDSLALGKSLAARARIYEFTAHPDSARGPAREAIALLRSVRQRRHIVGELGVLGDMFNATGQMDSAEFYTRARARELESSNDLSARVDNLNDLAAILAHRHQDAEVEPIQAKIVELERRRLGPRHPELASCLLALGATQVRLGKAAEGRANVTAARDMFIATLGPRHLFVASADLDLGRAADAQHDVPVAEASFAAAATLMRDLLGPRTVSLARTLEEWGQSRRRRGDTAGADSLLARAADIRRAR